MRSRPARAIIWLLAVGVCVVGLWISYDLTLKHLKVPTDKDSLLAQACTATETASCEEVINSEWGQFEFGEGKDKLVISTAELGLFYWTAVLCWLIFVGGTTPSRWWAHLIFVCGTAVGLGFCLFLLYQMSKLDHWCPLCAITHLSSLLLFIFALLLWPRKSRAAIPVAVSETGKAKAPIQVSKPVRHWPHWWMLIVTPVIALLMMGAEHLYFDAHITALKLKNAKWYQNYWKQQFSRYDGHWRHPLLAWGLNTPVKIDTEGLPFRGPANARHTLVVFSDFQCGVCKKFEHFLHDKIIPLSEKTGGLKVFFKHWPIGTACNAHAQKNLHIAACSAAAAAEAARMVAGGEAFWKMHDLLFKRVPGAKGKLSFVELAKEIGLDEEAFAKAMTSDEAMNQVKANIEEGATLGKGQVKDKQLKWINVSSTPAVFVDGKRLTTWKYLNTWKAILSMGPPKQPALKP